MVAQAEVKGFFWVENKTKKKFIQIHIFPKNILCLWKPDHLVKNIRPENSCATDDKGDQTSWFRA